ncbi:radical SAM protein [Lysinibacillus pakistanensis]|uniref:radical SAM protein n=1 Tax=Lysinibacillus pakistanensis TaxID=759811 RepID=UPI003D2ADBD4
MRGKKVAQIFANRPKVLPTSASILVTENCNLACTYCFEVHNTKVMTKETARKTLEFLCLNAVESGVGRFDAMIFGGEPLLNPEVVEEIFRYGVELSQKYNVTFTSNIITNCTVMNDKIKNMLIKWRDPANLTIQLSVDGKEEVQNRYRITKTGGGSFHLVEKNIPIFKEIFADDPRRLSIHGCVNRETVGSLYESFHFFKYDWGFKNIWFLPVIEEKWRLDDVVAYDEQNKLIFKDILKTIKETGDISPVYEYAPMDRCMDRQVRPSAPCGAGKNFVTVTCNGEIYPCHQIYFHDPEKETLIGNVYTGLDEPARTMYVDYTQENLSCPSTCENVHCFRCLAVNWIENGNIFSQVRGYYCYLSSTDKKYQDMLRKEVEKLGLMGTSSDAAGYRTSGEFAVDMDIYSGANNMEDCCGDGAYECGCGSKEKEHKDDLDLILADATCLCNTRESANSSINGCDIVSSRANAMPGNNPDNPDCLCDSRSSYQPYSFELSNKSMEEAFGQRIDVAPSEVQEIRDILKDKKEDETMIVEDQVIEKVDIDNIPEGADIISNNKAEEVDEAVTESIKDAEEVDIEVKEINSSASSDIARIMAEDDEPKADETLEERWSRYMKEAEEKTFGKEQEVNDNALAKYQDGVHRFITGEPVNDRLLIEVRIDKKKKIHLKYENILDKTIDTEILPYEGELPVGYYEVLDCNNLEQYKNNEDLSLPITEDEFQETVSLALHTIMERIISIEERLTKIENPI